MSLGASSHRIDIKAVSAAALRSLPDLLADWLPGGRREGHEYVVRNPTRSDGRPGSFSVNTASGKWSDFATGDKGGDAVSLYAFLNRTSQVDAARAVADRLGLARPEQAANDDPLARMKARADRKPDGGAEPERDPWTPVAPIPENEFAPLDVRLGGREPNKTWLFADAAGQPLGFECRWVKADGKDIHFACWCRHDDGRTEWRLKHLPSPRPIFGLDRLAKMPLALVLVFEGAKKVQPATRLFPDYVAVAWPGGAEAVKHVDWSPLAGRAVVVWPDNSARAMVDMTEALERRRGKGPQMMRIERVVVNEGGQAVVGQVMAGAPLPASASAPLPIGQGAPPMPALDAEPVAVGQGEGERDAGSDG